MMALMDDGSQAPRSGAGKVLVLPPAPDAIELRHLRAFVAVAEELNFGRAATRLFVSQPALSRQIRSLERLVGCDLLRRSTHRVELTLAGDALLDRARRLLADLDDAVFATRSVGGDLERRLAAAWEPVNDLTAAEPRPAGVARCRRAAARAVRDGRRGVGAAGDRRWRSVAAALAPAGARADGPAAPRRRLRDGVRLRLPAPGQRAGRSRRRVRDRARLPARPRASVPRRRRGRGARLPLDARLRRSRRTDRDGRRLRGRRARAVGADHAQAAGPSPARRHRAVVPGRRPQLRGGDRAPHRAAAGDQHRAAALVRRRLPRRHLTARRGGQRAARRPHRATRRC